MYYCGVCKSIGREFSHISRFGLVYETAILAILLDISSGNINEIKFSKSNCIAHPLKKSFYIEKCDSIEYAAAINVLLMYFKLQDNWQDDKSFLSLSGKNAIKRGFKKAAKAYPFAADSIFISIKDLNKIETQNNSSIDESSEPFAFMMSCLFKWLDCDSFINNQYKLELLGKIGYNVGKWIYLIDAISDIEEDDKNKSFNIFLLNKENKKDIKFILELCLANCANAYEELIKITEKEINADNINFINAKGVIDNLFYVGMRHITETKVGKLNESL